MKKFLITLILLFSIVGLSQAEATNIVRGIRTIFRADSPVEILGPLTATNISILSGANIWTGPSNTFTGPIYAQGIYAQWVTNVYDTVTNLTVLGTLNVNGPQTNKASLFVQGEGYFTNSVIAGVNHTIVNAPWSIVGGNLNDVQAPNCLVGGSNNYAYGACSVIGGSENYTDPLAPNSAAFGNGHTVASPYSFAAGQVCGIGYGSVYSFVFGYTATSTSNNNYLFGYKVSSAFPHNFMINCSTNPLTATEDNAITFQARKLDNTMGRIKFFGDVTISNAGNSVGRVLTCTNENGMAGWLASSGGGIPDPVGLSSNNVYTGITNTYLGDIRIVTANGLDFLFDSSAESLYSTNAEPGSSKKSVDWGNRRLYDIVAPGSAELQGKTLDWHFCQLIDVADFEGTNVTVNWTARWLAGGDWECKNNFIVKDSLYVTNSIFGNGTGQISNFAAIYVPSNSFWVGLAHVTANEGGTLLNVGGSPLATIDYVDSISVGNSAYYIRGLASDTTNADFGGTYYQLQRDYLSTSTFTNTINGVTNNQYIFAYITSAQTNGGPTFTVFNEGVYHVLWDMSRSGGNANNTVKPELYLRNSAGLEYYEFPSGSSVSLANAGYTHYATTVVATNAIKANPTDRLVLKFKFSGTGTPNVSIYNGSNAISMVQVSQPNANYVLRSGDTLNGKFNGNATSALTNFVSICGMEGVFDAVTVGGVRRTSWPTGGSSSPNKYFLHARNIGAHGATYTKIPILNTLATNTDVSETFMAWSTNVNTGSQLLIKSNGLYTFTFSILSPLGAVQQAGLSLNADATDCTRSINLLGVTTNLLDDYKKAVAGDDTTASVTVTVPLVNGDIIRPHTGGAQPDSSTLCNHFWATRDGD